MPLRWDSWTSSPSKVAPLAIAMVRDHVSTASASIFRIRKKQSALLDCKDLMRSYFVLFFSSFDNIDGWTQRPRNKILRSIRIDSSRSSSGSMLSANSLRASVCSQYDFSAISRVICPWYWCFVGHRLNRATHVRLEIVYFVSDCLALTVVVLHAVQSLVAVDSRAGVDGSIVRFDHISVRFNSRKRRIQVRCGHC